MKNSFKLNKLFIHAFTICFLTCLLAFSVSNGIQTEYLEPRDMQFTVADKITDHHKKTLVLKVIDSNHTFNYNVSRNEYINTNIGDTYYVTLSNMNVYPDFVENMKFYGYVFVIIFSFILLTIEISICMNIKKGKNNV